MVIKYGTPWNLLDPLAREKKKKLYVRGEVKQREGLEITERKKKES